MTVSLSRAQALADAAPQIGRREARELLLHVCACSHAELIARGGLYASLAALQFNASASATSA